MVVRPPPFVRGEEVQGVLTLICGGLAHTCHDDRVVELKGPVKEEGRRDRVKENAPWMT